MNSPKTPYSRGVGQGGEKQRSPLTTELQVPSMPQLLQMNKLQRSTEEIRKLAFQSRSTLNQETEYKLPGGDKASENVSKMKVKLNKMAARGGAVDSDKDKDGDDVPTFPEIKFPEMKEMPRIDIKLPAVSQAVKSTATVTTTTTTEKSNSSSIFSSSNSNQSKVTTASKQNNNNIFGTSKSTPTTTPIETSISTPVTRSETKADLFTFSAPIALKSSSAALSPVKMNFTFSEPLAGTTSGSASPALAAPAPVFGAFKFNPGTAKVKEGFSPVKAAAESAEPLPLKKGSVEDALGLTKKVESLPPFGQSSFGDKFKPATDSWSCSVCMIRNKSVDSKCVACETPKEEPAKKVAPAPTPIVSSNNSDSGFKALIASQKADKWECGDCMLKNDQSALKCCCCESPKPGSAAAVPAKSEPAKINSSNPFATGSNGSFAFGFKAGATTAAPPKADEGFGKLVSTQQAKWECSTCMTRNDQNQSKCACCEQAKPGAPEEKVPSFSFGAVSNSNKFSFGMPAAKTEEKEKPKEAIAATFSFGTSNSTSDSNKQQTTVDSSKAPAPAFAFGMPSIAKPTTETTTVEEKKPEEVKPATPALGGFKFGMSTASQETKTTITSEKAKEITPIGGFKFGASSATPATVAAAPITGGFSFGAAAVAKPLTVVEEKKPEAVKATPAPTFAFGSASATSVPSFGSPATTAEPKKIESITSPVFGGATTSLFGSASKEASKEIPKPTTGFGSTSATPFAFGSATAASATTSITSENNKAPQNTSTSLFGSPASTGGAIKPIAFGSQANETTASDAPKPAATFAFGAMAAKKDEPKVFGSSPSTFAFGGGNAQSSGAATGTSVFGMAAGASEGAKLGASTTSASPLFGGGMSSGTPSFGASAPVSTFGSGSPFGGAASAAKPAETPSLFGNNSASSGSPFGAAAPATGGIFGQQSASGGSSVPAFGSATTVGGGSFDVKDGAGASSPFQFGGSAGVSNNSNNVSRRDFEL